MKVAKIFILMLLSFTAAQLAVGRSFNDKLLNRPYADLRPWHLGFSVGTFSLNILPTHCGYVTEDGETWMVEQPDYSPGFCVNGLINWRCGDYIDVRFSPGMYFGNRDLKYREMNSGGISRQNLKSTFLVFPFDLKYEAARYRNTRPYLLGGVMPVIDLAKKQSDYLKLKPADIYLNIGFGIDCYLPYFKLIPELKFCFGLKDIIQHERPDLQDDPSKLVITQSLARATSRMIVLTFYFE